MNDRQRQLIGARAKYSNPYAFLYTGDPADMRIEHTILGSGRRLAFGALTIGGLRTRAMNSTHSPVWIIAEMESIYIAKLGSANTRYIQPLVQLEMLCKVCETYTQGRKRDMTYGEVAWMVVHGVSRTVLIPTQDGDVRLSFVVSIPADIKEILETPLCMF